jgi:hypothetical protein
MAGQLVHNASDTALGAAADTFSMFGNRTVGTNWARTVIPTPGTATKLWIELSAAPGTGNTRTFKVWKNGALPGTPLSVTFGATDTQKEDNSTSYSLVAGDYLDLRHTYTGTPASAQIRWGWIWTPTITDRTILVGTTDTTKLGSTTAWIPLSGCISAPTTGFNRLWLPEKWSGYLPHC